MRSGALLVCAALLSMGSAVSAQLSPGARSVAMGGGGMVYASGVDAVEWNPANLGWSDGWNVSAFELGVAGLGEGATVNEILSIFGADIGGAAALNVSDVVAGLPADGIALSFVTEGFATAYAADRAEVPGPGSPLPSIGVAVGNVAVRLRSRVFTSLTLSRELADLIGNGFREENLLDYAVGNTGWRSAALSEITVSYGYVLGIMSVGVGGRYITGHTLVDGRFFEPDIDANCIGATPPSGCVPISVTSVAVEATGGSGFGLDIGVSLDLPGGLRTSASGTNVAQTLTWDDELVAHTAVYTDVDFRTDEDFVDLLDRFEGEPLDPEGAALPVYLTAEDLFEQSYFPQTYRLGVGWRSDGGTTLEAMGTKVSPRGRFSNVWDERLSIGVEQALPVVTLRGGYAVADQGITALTGGLGLAAGPVLIELSGGRFSGEDATLGSPWEGYFGTVAVQLVGGGS